AASMRGIPDGGEVEWDLSAVPADGGLPARERSSSRRRPIRGESSSRSTQTCVGWRHRALVVVETGGRPVVVGGDVAVWFGELDEPHTEGQLQVRAGRAMDRGRFPDHYLQARRTDSPARPEMRRR